MGRGANGVVLETLSVICPLFALAIALPIGGAVGDWRAVFSGELRNIQGRIATAHADLAALGAPVVGNTVPQFGYQHLQSPMPPPQAPWVQVDLGVAQRLDLVALVPVLVDFQSIGGGAYGFPRRFRVDLSNDASFASFTPLLVHTDEDFPPPGAAPVVIAARGTAARYIRVTVTRLAEENATFFFALAELMALQGSRNVALGGKVTASNSVNIAPRWNVAFLTDGRTPLGPPIRYGVMPQFDGIFAKRTTDDQPAWMAIDLGSVQSLDEVRLHPLHARQGADVPGFRFPEQFRVELSAGPTFADSQVLFDSGGKDYPNPGNNPVTIVAQGKPGRHLRVMSLKNEAPALGTFALSEIEALAGGRTVSLGAAVSTSGDDPKRNVPRPPAQLTDGFTSFGRLIDLTVWMEEWARRAALQSSLRALESDLPSQAARAERRAGWTAFALFLSAGMGVAFVMLRTTRSRLREQERFRTQLAQDLHDEIGSNLAGIARLSENATQSDQANAADLCEIHRIAHESTEAMREVLWLVGARQEMGIELGPQMQTAAGRLLPGRTIRWTHVPDTIPAQWSLDTRRQLFLFFKEALTNVVRHAKASEVELSAQVVQGVFELLIRDNGRGFDVATAPAGLGLKSLGDRAAVLGGMLVVESQPGIGTQVSLKIPISSR